MPLAQLTASLLALAGILALILVGQRLLQPGGRLRPALGGRLRVLDSVAIDPRRRLVLAQCDGQEFVLLTGGTSDLLVMAKAAGEQP